MKESRAFHKLIYTTLAQKMFSRRHTNHSMTKIFPAILMLSIGIRSVVAQQGANATTALTDQTIQQAVILWELDRAAAQDQYGDIEDWDTSAVTSFRYLFRDRQDEFKHNLNRWNTSQVTSLFGLAQNAPFFQAEISGWDTSSVQDITRAFSGATRFAGDISLFETKNVVSMLYTFDGAERFNAPISNWNTTSCVSMLGIFQGKQATILFDTNIRGYMF